MRYLLVGALVLAGLAGQAHAQAPDAAEPLGPLIVIEDIEVVGNRSTQEDVILRALPIHVGDELRAGDPKLRDARFKLLALGFFRTVTLAQRKGSERGHVVITITVTERGTVVLNRLWFGTSSTSPWWLGADVGERNLIGTGVGVGGGLVYAAKGDEDGARGQYAGELRIDYPSLLGTAFGIDGSFTLVHGSEPYRIAGTDDDAARFRAFDFDRTVGRGGLTWDVTALTQLSAGLRLEALHTDLPDAPTRTLPDGRTVGVDLHLRPGQSHVVSIDLGVDRDTRADPVLPRVGNDEAVEVELGSSLLGGSYDYARILARWERWWPIGSNAAFAARFAGGVVIGDAPRFERIYVGDVDRMLEPRALGLAVSGEGSANFLHTGTAGLDYGEVGGSAIAEYSQRLFRRHSVVYAGDWFVGGGLWGLATRDDLALRDQSLWHSLPVDLVFDAGVRLDTDIGIFELTIANALGRVPL